MRGRSALLGLWVTLSALCLVRGTAAQAQATETWQQQTMTFFDECNNFVEVTATLNVHTVVTTVIDSSGGSHQHVTTDASGTGVGSDGTVYVIHQTVPSGADNTNGSQNETYSVGEIQLITKGPEPNSLVFFLFHTTMNANGVTTAAVFQSTERCVG